MDAIMWDICGTLRGYRYCKQEDCVFLKRLTLENQMEAKTKEMHISKDDQVPPRSSQMCIAGPSQKPEMD